MIENPPAVDRIIQRALAEDIGDGDLTTEAVVDASAEGRATLLAKEELVLAGLPVFCRTSHHVLAPPRRPPSLAMPGGCGRLDKLYVTGNLLLGPTERGVYLL